MKNPIKSKLIITILIILCLVTILIPAGKAYAMAGDGTVSDPYVITTVNDLQNISLDLTANYTLGNDIDASATSGWNGGAGFVPLGDNPIDMFNGSLDGCGYTITGLFINRSSTDGVGLFGLMDVGSVERVGLINVNITGHFYVGGLVGYNAGGISNSYVTGNVSGNIMVGGLVGAFALGTIVNSYSTCRVTGLALAGGLIGAASGSGTNVSCYWDNQTSGCLTSVGGEGKTTAEMKQQATFVGWNFTIPPIIWYITEGVSYPSFQAPSPTPTPTPSPFNRSLLLVIALVWVCIGLLFMVANTEEGIFIMIIIALLIIAGVAAIVPLL